MNLTILPIKDVSDELIRVLNDRFRQLTADVPQTASGSAAGLTFLHSARASANLANLGTYGTETDRGVVYQVRSVGSSKAWCYSSGMMKADFADAPTDLSTNDVGFLWYVSDYAHVLRWDGSGWEWVDGEGDYIVGRHAAPTGNGWQLCDGSGTHHLAITAGVVSEVAFTTPNLTGSPAYPKFNSIYTGIVAANAPSVGSASRGTATPLAPNCLASISADAEPAHLSLIPYYRR